MKEAKSLVVRAFGIRRNQQHRKYTSTPFRPYERIRINTPDNPKTHKLEGSVVSAVFIEKRNKKNSAGFWAIIKLDENVLHSENTKNTYIEIHENGIIKAESRQSYPGHVSNRPYQPWDRVAILPTGQLGKVRAQTFKDEQWFIKVRQDNPPGQTLHPDKRDFWYPAQNVKKIFGSFRDLEREKLERMRDIQRAEEKL
jgi:hypothetical protein